MNSHKCNVTNLIATFVLSGSEQLESRGRGGMEEADFKKALEKIAIIMNEMALCQFSSVDRHN